METVKIFSKHDKMCQDVLNLSKSIRFAGIITEHGNLLTCRIRSGIELKMNKKEQEMLFTEIGLWVRMRRQEETRFGITRFSLSYRDTLMIMIFPLKKRIFVLSSEPNGDFGKTVLEILNYLASKHQFPKYFLDYFKSPYINQA